MSRMSIRMRYINVNEARILCAKTELLSDTFSLPISPAKQMVSKIVFTILVDYANIPNLVRHGAYPHSSSKMIIVEV